MKQNICDGVTEEPLSSVTRRTPHQTEQFIKYWNKQQANTADVQGAAWDGHKGSSLETRRAVGL